MSDYSTLIKSKIEHAKLETIDVVAEPAELDKLIAQLLIWPDRRIMDNPEITLKFLMQSAAAALYRLRPLITRQTARPTNKSHYIEQDDWITRFGIECKPDGTPKIYWANDQIQNLPREHIWTQITDDTTTTIVCGFHYVNRDHYYLASRAPADKQEESMMVLVGQDSFDAFMLDSQICQVVDLETGAEVCLIQSYPGEESTVEERAEVLLGALNAHA